MKQTKKQPALGKAKAGGARGGASTSNGSKVSLGATAYSRIRQAIQDGVFTPGDRVLEDEIAKQLAISRTPVREALRRLEDEGFLVHEAHRGMTVSKLDYQMIMELYAMRDVLEGAAAAMAARHATEAEVEVLTGLLVREQKLLSSPERMAEHNRRFHQAIYQCAHNRYLLKTLSVLADSLALLSRTTFSLPERRPAAAAEHRAIVDAIREHDAQRAETAARDHIRAAQRARLSLMAEGQEL